MYVEFIMKYSFPALKSSCLLFQSIQYTIFTTIVKWKNNLAHQSFVFDVPMCAIWLILALNEWQPTLCLHSSKYNFEIWYCTYGRTRYFNHRFFLINLKFNTKIFWWCLPSLFWFFFSFIFFTFQIYECFMIKPQSTCLQYLFVFLS